MRTLAAGLAAAVLLATPVASAAEPASALAPVLLLDAATAGGAIVAVGEWGTIVASPDAGRSWTRASSPTENTLTALAFVDAAHGWAVGHNGTVLATADGGRHWADQTPDAEAVDPLLGVAFLDLAHGFAAGHFGLLLETDDGGGHWRPRDLGQGDAHLKAVATLPPDRVLIAGENGLVLVSADAGQSFARAATGYDGSFWGARFLGGDAAVVFGMRGTVFRTADGGKSWARVLTGTTAGLSAACVLPPDTLVLAGSEGTVLVSRDAGASFRPEKLADRRTINALAPAEDGRVLLLGRFPPEAAALPDPAR